MKRLPALRVALLAATLVAASWSCDSDPTGPPDGPDGPVVSRVVLGSPLDSILDAESDVQISATAEGPNGTPLSSPALEWSSSDTGVLTVTSAGLVSTVGTGTAIVTAGVSGSTVAGTLRLRVVDADLELVAGITSDPLVGAVTGALSTATAPLASGAWDDCASAAADGHIVHLIECAALVRQQATAATDPTDQRLLVALSLLADHVERSLGL